MYFLEQKITLLSLINQLNTLGKSVLVYPTFLYAYQMRQYNIYVYEIYIAVIEVDRFIFHRDFSSDSILLANST